MAAAWTARASSRSARGLSEVERGYRLALSHRCCSCFIVSACPFSGLVCRRPTNSRLRAKEKAREAGASRAFGSDEMVGDQDVTATSATRPKSRVATRASVQQHHIDSCIRTVSAMPESPTSVKAQRDPPPRFPARSFLDQGTSGALATKRALAVLRSTVPCRLRHRAGCTTFALIDCRSVPCSPG